MLLMPLFLIPFVNLQRFSLTLLDRWVSKPALHTPNMLWFEHYSIAIRGEQAKSAGEKPLADSVFEDSIACGGAPGQVAGRTRVRPTIVRALGTAGATDGRAPPGMRRGGVARRTSRDGGDRRRGRGRRLRRWGGGPGQWAGIRGRSGRDSGRPPTRAGRGAQAEARPQRVGRPEGGPVAGGTHGA